jgi:hypothetical protein
VADKNERCFQQIGNDNGAKEAANRRINTTTGHAAPLADLHAAAAQKEKVNVSPEIWNLFLKNVLPLYQAFFIVWPSISQLLAQRPDRFKEKKIPFFFFLESKCCD